MRTRTWGSLVTAVTVSAVLLTGCGESEADKFAAQSAEKIAEDARQAMEDLEAVTIDGELTADGEDIELRMEIGDGGNCQGEFTTEGATAEILGVDGATWFKPDAAFWELQVGDEAAAAQIIEAVGDKWVTLPEGDESFSQFCDIEEFLDELTDDGDEATYSKGETKEIGGDEAIEIISSREDEGDSSGYIRLDGEHYILQIEKTEGDEPGTVNFSGFDEQPDVEAPADDEQISLDELG
jgi:hypothetical protein